MAMSEDSVMAVIRASRPCFRKPHDKVVFALHATFLASGYTLTATGAEALSEINLSSPPSDEVGVDGWNQFEDKYGFVYSKDDTKNVVLVKCLVMGDQQLVIDAISSKNPNQEPSNLQINVSEYDGGDDSKNYAEKYKNFSKLVTLLSTGILKKMEGSSTEKTSSSSSVPSRSETSVPPGHREESQDPEPYPHGVVHPPVFPGHHDDLLPGPGAGMFPRRSPGIGGGPMLIGPNDPRWFRPDGGQPGFPDGSLGVPPGARFDPYGPPGVPGFEPNRFARNPRRPGSHPDLEPFRDHDFI